MTGKAVRSTGIGRLPLGWKPRVFGVRVCPLVWRFTSAAGTFHPVFFPEEEGGEEVALGLGLPSAKIALGGALVPDELGPLAGAKSVEGAGSGAYTSFGTVGSSVTRSEGRTTGEKSAKTTSLSRSTVSSPRRMILKGTTFLAVSGVDGIGGCFGVCSASDSDMYCTPRRVVGLCLTPYPGIP
jgi:hypothetical protein